MNSNTQWAEEIELDVLVKKNATKSLVLYNDDVNTFDYVIETLIQICGHDAIQAEQSAFLVHYTGRCAVKNGSFKQLKPMCEALLDKGLSATIEN